MDAAGLLRRARHEARLSQRAVADAAGVRQPLVCRIETGREQPGLHTLARLVAACGYSLRLDLEPVVDPHELTLMETNLRLSPQQRVDRLVGVHRAAAELRAAVRRTAP